MTVLRHFTILIHSKTVNLRTRTGKSQFQMAMELGKTPNTIHNWEHGIKFPVFQSLDQIKLVMASYQCSFPEFLEVFGKSQIKLSVTDFEALLKSTAGVSLENILKAVD